MHDECWDQQMFVILVDGLDRAAEFAAKNGIQFKLLVEFTKGHLSERHLFTSHEDGCVITPIPNRLGTHRLEDLRNET
jgi:hypothetical protein